MKIELLFLFEIEMNYLQNIYNISRHFLKTSLHYRVKHKIALSICDDKAVKSTI